MIPAGLTRSALRFLAPLRAGDDAWELCPGIDQVFQGAAEPHGPIDIEDQDTRSSERSCVAPLTPFALQRREARAAI